ncbi:hypothetical protein [Polaromonas sp. JS666]|uniref:hypothetical protein n=1 Tax=Polaromonas sp. (strain JS666 / ATCC BAA-500) TaxID=296591 RepID=UPI00111332F4|nr:hypothetical protein [Polaromonas sp. JS666]
MQVFKAILNGICDLDPMPHSPAQKNIMNAVRICSKHYRCGSGTFDGCLVFSVLIELKGERLAFEDRDAVLALTNAEPYSFKQDGKQFLRYAA